ncbi:hypothetical protein BJ322DRAFT_837231 [Thelephora terrestris]|uniref:Uncharacterized protein n=1 Tax=Thelephora terrestris TaxID=56493 RepID=A0A9P6L7F8_9AGAM|nr:hypothetical protein BJ322DRAFT_837231 [Thelephora terrestris]
MGIRRLELGLAHLQLVEQPVFLPGQVEVRRFEGLYPVVKRLDFLRMHVLQRNRFIWSIEIHERQGARTLSAAASESNCPLITWISFSCFSFSKATSLSNWVRRPATAFSLSRLACSISFCSLILSTLSLVLSALSFSLSSFTSLLTSSLSFSALTNFCLTVFSSAIAFVRFSSSSLTAPLCFSKSVLRSLISDRSFSVDSLLVVSAEWEAWRRASVSAACLRRRSISSDWDLDSRRWVSRSSSIRSS